MWENRIARSHNPKSGKFTAIHLLDPQELPQYVDRLYRAAWALCGSRDDAEDLVQETFAKTLARPRMVRGDSDLAYLMSGLRNTYFSGRRTSSRRPAAAITAEEFEIADARPTARPAEAYEAHELFAAIAELPEDFRLALVSVDVAGLTYREAGKALGVPEATIATRVYRARERVAKSVSGTNADDSESVLVKAIDD